MKLGDISQYQGEFFKVLGGTELSQVAVMTIAPGGDSGYENAHTGDQVVYIVAGTATVNIEGVESEAEVGDVLIIPKGAQHQIFNRDEKPLFFLNVYTPPQY